MPVPNLGLHSIENSDSNESVQISHSQQPPAAWQSPALRTYRVSLGPPQWEEAGEEELAPADDGSQAPVEASHACFLPVSSASLSAPGLDPATHPPPPTPPSEEKKEEADWSWSVQMNQNPFVKWDGEIYFPLCPGFASVIPVARGDAGEAPGVPRMDETLGRRRGTLRLPPCLPINLLHLLCFHEPDESVLKVWRAALAACCNEPLAERRRR